MTLHRPPPEMRTFAKSWRVFSRTMTEQEGLCAAHAIAAKIPAAPPPTMITVNFFCIILRKRLGLGFFELVQKSQGSANKKTCDNAPIDKAASQSIHFVKSKPKLLFKFHRDHTKKTPGRRNGFFKEITLGFSALMPRLSK